MQLEKEVGCNLCFLEGTINPRSSESLLPSDLSFGLQGAGQGASGLEADRTRERCAVSTHMLGSPEA